MIRGKINIENSIGGTSMDLELFVVFEFNLFFHFLEPTRNVFTELGTKCIRLKGITLNRVIITQV